MTEEAQVGITEFLNPNLHRFQGILKHRYSDFIVDEIGLDGEVAQLTDQIYEADLQPHNGSAVAFFGVEEIKEDISVKEKFLKNIEGVLNENEVNKILDLMDKGLNKSDDKDIAGMYLTPSIPSKESRTLLHTVIRKHFGSQLVSSTVEDDKVQVVLKSNSKRLKTDNRNLQDPNRVPFIRFVLQKENVDTIEAIQQISKRLMIPSKCLSFAGTKDRRAITRQFIVARFLNPAKIAGINKTCNAAGTKNLKVSNIVKTDRMLKLGDLKGNRFTLLLRDVKGATDEGIETAMQLLKQNGFINYFGLQRFGTSSLGSHQIGALLLRQDWQSTIDAILGEREGETDQAAIKARQIWRETKSAKAAHDAFPPRHQAERQILWHFHKQNGSTDLVGAILSISRELRLMYVHGFQSAVWNRLVSRRIAEFGRAPVVGDIVLVDEKPVILTEDNLCSFSMSDVVLPMPGYDMIYPKGVLSAVVKEVIEGEFKISTESCCFQPKTKTLWDLPGAYRRAVVMPEALTWAIGYLESVDAPSESFHSESDHMKCIQVSLGLPTSAYATMALREVMELVSSK